MNYTYTFIMDYLGGTYISQVEAATNREAMDVWLRELKVEEIEHFTERDKANLIAYNFTDEDPVLIRGMINVWCIGVRTGRGYGAVNIVKTDVHGNK